MKQINHRAVLLAVLANLLAGVFLWAALSKLGAFGDFQRSLARTGLVPTWGLGFVSSMIPGVEIVLAFALSGLRPDRVGLYLVTALLTGFLVFQIYTATQVGWLGKVQGGCPCFASGSGTNATAQVYLVARNLLLLSLSAWAVWLELFGSAPLNREAGM